MNFLLKILLVDLIASSLWRLALDFRVIFCLNYKFLFGLDQNVLKCFTDSID